LTEAVKLELENADELLIIDCHSFSNHPFCMKIAKAFRDLIFVSELMIFLTLPIFANTLTGKVVKTTDGDTVHLLLPNHDK